MIPNPIIPSEPMRNAVMSSEPSRLAMEIAVSMEMHAALSTTTRAKAEAIQIALNEAAEPLADLIERLERGVESCGLHDDNSTELFDVEDASSTMAEAALVIKQLSARLATADVTEAMVERVARAIDPDKFEFWQSSYDYQISNGADAEKARAFADYWHKLEPVREQARAAIAALNPPMGR